MAKKCQKKYIYVTVRPSYTLEIKNRPTEKLEKKLLDTGEIEKMTVGINEIGTIGDEYTTIELTDDHKG